ncbi:MAG TPA: cyclic nucleotide-binding domain-containing protein [Kofleriaceae bacterium]|nr:cyclic nucleotide-binding domain-containing protein [Kofleriaceae bacterium]
MNVTPDHLTRATRRLRQHPLDYGAWLEVAALLEALGGPDDAELAFGTIGESARLGGQVALAIACGRHLAQIGSVRGPELIEQVIDTYAEIKAPKGKRKKQITRPPTEPIPTVSVPQVPEGDGTPLEEARLLVTKLGEWLTKREVANRPLAPLVSSLSKLGARALVGVMTARAVPAGTVIIDAGEPATALYWIAHGTVIVARGKGYPMAGTTADIPVLGELHSGAFFGEIALVGGTKRTARVTAHDDVWLLEIPARAVETAAQKHPKLAEVLAIHARQRLLANLMRTSELFRALEDDDRDALLAKFTTQLVPEGTMFIHEGQANEFLWVVVSGRCQVKAAGAAITELGPGAAVGEISLVSGAVAVADVEAIEPAVLLRLSKQDFDVVAQKHPALLAEVEKLVVAREQANRALFQDATDLIV